MNALQILKKLEQANELAYMFDLKKHYAWIDVYNVDSVRFETAKGFETYCKIEYIEPAKIYEANLTKVGKNEWIADDGNDLIVRISIYED